MKMSLPGAPVRVVLRSAFAEDEGDFLEFVLAGDTVEMMETPWTRRLDDKVSTNHERPARVSVGRPRFLLCARCRLSFPPSPRYSRANTRHPRGRSCTRI